MILDPALAETGAHRRAVRDAHRAGENEVVAARRHAAELDAEAAARVERRARELVDGVRGDHRPAGIDAFMQEYELSSQEGVVLMCLAEALLRVPDTATMDELIADKIATADWEAHLGHSESIFVNASTWALVLTGRVIRLDDDKRRDFGRVLRQLIHRSGEPVIRTAVMRAMRIMGREFVLGRTIREGLDRAREQEARGYRYSYDVLGEAARTMADADAYRRGYLDAIEAIGRNAAGAGPIRGPGISVKLSALHPRFELGQRERVMGELLPRLREICRAAAHHDIGLCIDAEETERLDLSLDVIDAVSADPDLKGWNGLGCAVQAYQKRAAPVLDWLAATARRDGRRLMVRLVKGAYWDMEVKHAQERGLDEYPVFTRKVNTDVSYLACVQRMLAHSDAIYPQFATHNAHTAAYVMAAVGDRTDFEFQRLHGMGEALHDRVIAHGHPCRIYAPIGGHAELLPYLVRRLLENGANTSFVNHLTDERVPVEEIVADPVRAAAEAADAHHPHIPLPRDLYGPERANALGVDLSDPQTLAPLGREMDKAALGGWEAAPIVGGDTRRVGNPTPIVDPADHRRTVGHAHWASPAEVDAALDRASRAQLDWDRTPAETRARCLDAAADEVERRMGTFMGLAVREGGKTVPDAVAEVREAIDFLRYYAAEARRRFGGPIRLPGPSGERNELTLHGRGVWATISPWNQLLALFTGPTAAALAAGNAVVAKPAEQTPLTAAEMTRVLHRAGVPEDVLHLLPGDGAGVGEPLVQDRRVAGVAFTGGLATAKHINRLLAERDGPIVPFIAETGGLNAMIVDSTALPEQAVVDIVNSAFMSAGQRCSGLRVLFVQNEVADTLIRMLTGAMDELRLGDPGWLRTDIGPVIAPEAQDAIERHAQAMARQGTLLRRAPMPEDGGHGTFVAPAAFEIDRMNRLRDEVFGPMLHIVRYDRAHLDKVIDAVNATGFGLTHGVHSRIDTTVNHIAGRVRVGNCYANRNIVGSVVGVQPFGGEGLSGTGPKAGGPHYLPRFAVERTLTIDTTAAGGNASLLALD